MCRVPHLKNCARLYNGMVESKLRTGYTTGTCAAAGARAALEMMLGNCLEQTPVLLPRGDHLEVPIKSCRTTITGGAICVITKDGGDDPDVTHGTDIVVEVSRSGQVGTITIQGGEGVGVVTKPGLGLDIGGPAINPTPRRMIQENLAEVDCDVLKNHGLVVVVSVPAGRDLAPKTDNPRLGIVGGISILGTSGIVVPFSTASFAASIRQSIDVIVAMGDTTAVLATGGRSEEFARRMMDLPDHCFVQMGDFSGYAVRQCQKKRLDRVCVVGFVGKLAKIAAGVSQTHVKGSKVDTKMLAAVAAECGAGPNAVDLIRAANTARHVMEMVLKDDMICGFFDRVCCMVQEKMAARAPGARIEVVMFDFEGSVLGRADGLGHSTR